MLGGLWWPLWRPEVNPNFLEQGRSREGFLKSPDFTVVPVQVRPRAPIKSMTYIDSRCLTSRSIFYSRRIVDRLFPYYPITLTSRDGVSIVALSNKTCDIRCAGSCYMIYYL